MTDDIFLDNIRQGPKVVMVVTGDVHSSIGQIVEKKTELSETAPENQTVQMFSKFAGSVGLEAQMLSLAYRTFPRNYSNPDTLEWNCTETPVQELAVLGPTALALMNQGYPLRHDQLRNDFFTVQPVGSKYDETMYRRLGDRSSKRPEQHAEFKPLDVSRLVPDAVVKTVLISVEADDFLTKADHVAALKSLATDRSCPWFVAKLRWTTDGGYPSPILGNVKALAQSAVGTETIGSRIACVLSADNIRRSNLPISNRLSWERTAQETIERLTESNEVSDALSGCRVLVVSYSYEGALIGVTPDKGGSRQWWLVYEPDTIEGDIYGTTRGTTRGRLSTMACALAYSLHREGDRACDAVDVPGIVESVRRGLVAARLSHLRGLTKTPQSCTSDSVLPTVRPIIPLHTGYAPISSRIILSQPYDVMSEVIRSDDLDRVTWVPNSAAVAGDPDRTARLHRRLKSVTQIIDDCFGEARKIATTRILRGQFADNKPGQSRFEKTWWSLLEDCTETLADPAVPGTPDQKEAMRELARLAFVHGPRVLSDPFPDKRKVGPLTVPLAVPVLRYGDFSAVDRAEIETYREVYALISQADRSGFRTHVNIGVFGEPGSGKSFAIKEIVKALKSDQIAEEPIVKDLSQFTTEDDLNEAFREIADVVLQGKVPIVFWDEYDSSRDGHDFGWLQAFLEPMQARHHSSGFIGRSVFVFAGSRFRSSDELQFADLYASLGLDSVLQDIEWTEELEPEAVQEAVRGAARNASEAEVQTAAMLYGALRPTGADMAKYQKFAASKGRDFKSRLTRTIDVTGVNSSPSRSRRTPHSHLVKRAMLARETLFRSFRTLFDEEKRTGRLNIAPRVVDAILSEVKYVHGARSLETILRACSALGATQLTPSHLPMDDQLRMHLDDVAAFEHAFARG